MLEDPTDFAANHLVEFLHQISISTKHFVSIYLLIYGITKIGLAAGLLRGKLWAYPAALTVLGVFLCYQVYRFGHNHSIGFGLVSVLDLIVLALIWRNYKCKKTHRNKASLPKSKTTSKTVENIMAVRARLRFGMQHAIAAFGSVKELPQMEHRRLECVKNVQCSHFTLSQHGDPTFTRP